MSCKITSGGLTSHCWSGSGWISVTEVTASNRQGFIIAYINIEVSKRRTGNVRIVPSAYWSRSSLNHTHTN